MKKIVRALSALAVFLTFVPAPSAFAATCTTSNCPSDFVGPPAPDAPKDKSGGSFVYVTEKIPGANCSDANRGTTQTTRLYKCTVGKGFDTVVGVLGSLIKYATYLTGLIGVLMIVLSGIQYSLSGGGEDAKKAKGRIIQLVTGLVLLFLV